MGFSNGGGLSKGGGLSNSGGLSLGGGLSPGLGGLWIVSGVEGCVTTLRQLGTILTSSPSSDVLQIGNYDASRDGVFSASPINASYTGTFNAGSYAIRNLTITDASFTRSQNDGLFSVIGTAGTVKNLTIGGTITQVQRQAQTADGLGRFLLGATVGSLCGTLNGTADNCHTNAVVVGNGAGGRYGGLVGFTSTTGRLINCTSNATASITSNCYNAYLSSFDAYNNGFVSGCANYGTSIAPSGTTLWPPTNAQIATFTAIIAGTTLTISNLIAGTPAIGQYVYAGGDGSAVVYGTRITGGSGSVWTVDTSQTVASCDMVTGAGGPYLTTGAWQGGLFGANGLTNDTTCVSFVGATHSTDVIDGIADTTGIVVGEYVVGDGIPDLATVLEVHANDIKISAAATATAAGVTFRAATALVYNCTSSGTQTGSSNDNAANYCGGLGGINAFGVVVKSSASSRVTGAASCGGLFGRQYGPVSFVSRSFATGAVNGSSRVGGLIGENWGTADQVYATGNVVGTDSSGALIGTNIDNSGHDCIVTNWFAFGNVTGNTQVGGGFGTNQGIMDAGYAIGYALGGAAVGGCVGGDAYDAGITNCYWDTTRSGTSVGAGNVAAPTGITGKTTAQLLAALPTGFGAKWTRDGAGIVAGGYPYLVNVTPPSAPVAQNAPVWVILTTTGGASWSVPANWNNSINQIHNLGAGGDGAAGLTTTAGRGGGSGAYVTNINVTLTPGASIPYTIGAGGSAVATNFNSGMMIAAAGTSGTTSVTGTGGTTAASVGQVKSAGANGGVNTGGSSGGGGAGAAGPVGSGKAAGGGSGNGTNSGGGGGGGNGGTAGTGGTSTGGGNGGNAADGISLGGAGSTDRTVAGGNGSNGAAGGGGYSSILGGSNGGNGSSGSVWNGVGPGGGGAGGGGLNNCPVAGAGGSAGYGGGGGGGGRGLTPGALGPGGQGLVAAWYIPA